MGNYPFTTWRRQRNTVAAVNRLTVRGDQEWHYTFHARRDARQEIGNSSVGRKRRWAEDMAARFPAGTLARIDAVLRDNEYRTDFVWQAVERELKRREARAAKPAKSRT
jgi:hypothetical protein